MIKRPPRLDLGHVWGRYRVRRPMRDMRVPPARAAIVWWLDRHRARVEEVCTRAVKRARRWWWYDERYDSDALISATAGDPGQRFCSVMTHQPIVMQTGCRLQKSVVTQLKPARTKLLAVSVVLATPQPAASSTHPTMSHQYAHHAHHAHSKTPAAAIVPASGLLDYEPEDDTVYKRELLSFLLPLSFCPAGFEVLRASLGRLLHL